MSVIDFKEIPEAHVASGEQDSFELFAADFLESLGFEVVTRPGRGQDLGQDLEVIEQRTGVAGQTTIRWLVSCKHKAHSGRSVKLTDEENLVERVEGKHCHGFLGFYSTLPSSSLVERLKSLSNRFEYQIFDRGRIEKYLLAENSKIVAARFFPKSMDRCRAVHRRPADVFSELELLACHACGKNLLSPKASGILVLWEAYDGSQREQDAFVDVHWCCKGNCDEILERQMRRKHGDDVLDSWEDIPDFCVPLLYLKRFMGILNGLHAGDTWTPEAFAKFKTFLVTVFPHVARDARPDEKKRIKELLTVPGYLGGLGT
jgi:hypothetical protein